MTPDPATIREFVARTRQLCDAATPLQEARSGSIYTESGEWLAEFAFRRDAEFAADARTSLPAALSYIKALLAERDRDAPVIRAAVRLAADVCRRRRDDTRYGELAERHGLSEWRVPEAYGSGYDATTDLGRAVLALDERMGPPTFGDDWKSGAPPRGAGESSDAR